jgi:Na+(H+)/acetate symporter ActP
VFVFYLYYSTPIIFNQKLNDKIAEASPQDYAYIMQQQDSLNKLSAIQTKMLTDAIKANDPISATQSEIDLHTTTAAKEDLRKKTKGLISRVDPTADTNDTNYIFLYFVTHHLPKGLIGLLIAVIFLSAWGSIAAALHSLSTSSIIDLYKRMLFPNKSEIHYYRASKWATFFWGIFCIATAMFATKLGSLIEAVNILGSLFYGTILGIFVVAFYLKSIKSEAVLIGAIFAELAVIMVYIADWVSFLWLNVIGCLLVILISALYEKIIPSNNTASNH